MIEKTAILGSLILGHEGRGGASSKLPWEVLQNNPPGRPEQGSAQGSQGQGRAGSGGNGPPVLHVLILPDCDLPALTLLSMPSETPTGTDPSDLCPHHCSHLLFTGWWQRAIVHCCPERGSGSFMGFSDSEAGDLGLQP